MLATHPAPLPAPPDHTRAERLFLEGTRALHAGDLALAERTLRKAVAADGRLAEAHANLALALEKQDKFAKAEACYRTSIECNPRIARTHLNLGAMLASQKRFDEAEAAYLQASHIDPGLAAAWSNLGVLYACTKREDEAAQCYRKALSLDPGYKLAAYNLGYLRLRQGRFEEGWRGLEARDWYAAFAQRMRCPRWQGESLRGKSVLIGCEAGHGDMIQFARYAAVLKGQGASHITLVCHPALRRLFSTLAGVDRVARFDEPLTTAHFDYWTPPLSIPHYCGTRVDSIPAPLPYLSALPGEKENWAVHFSGERLHVGLAWKGNPKFENDADRSLPSLDVLAPLGAVDGVRFVSLQRHVAEDEAKHPPKGLPLLPLGSMAEDFADIAAIIANLDLVIAVDTAVAHLAGAMGKPCWLLLPDYKTDWRWLEDRDDSPWYPGAMRLFRQRAPGNWKATIDEVSAALETLALR